MIKLILGILWDRWREYTCSWVSCRSIQGEDKLTNNFGFPWVCANIKLASLSLITLIVQVVEDGEMVGAWYQPNDASKLAMSVGDKVALVDLGSSGPLKVRRENIKER